MAFRRRLKGKSAPEGWDLIESVVEDFEQQMKDAVNEDHEGKRKVEGTWRITRVHWEKNRFLFDLMYRKKAISRELFEWCVREKVADGALIAKWRKPGYENLCSMLAIQKGDSNYGNVAMCRVPVGKRAAQGCLNPSQRTGCISCATGDNEGGDGPVWWNTALPEGFAQRRRDKESGKGKGKKRPAPDGDDDVDPEVAKRIAALKGGA